MRESDTIMGEATDSGREFDPRDTPPTFSKVVRQNVGRWLICRGYSLKKEMEMVFIANGDGAFLFWLPRPK